MPKTNFNLRRLRLSLKYRPEILKLILKMRQCIRRKNSILMKLKHRLKLKEPNNITDKLSTKHTDELKSTVSNSQNNLLSLRTVKTTNDQITENSKITKSLTRDNEEPIKVDSSTQTDDFINNKECEDKSEVQEPKWNLNTENGTDGEGVPIKKDSSTQTDDPINKECKSVVPTQEAGWNLNKENSSGEKSLAEQVKEAAQSALQQTGMVYVESAGMYYDYKTGYYYNSELGLYYHTDTECYYTYSDEKQTFAFHSYPDRSAMNASLIAHEKKKAKKHKTERKTEDIDNLTKNLSQEKEDDANRASKPKRRKTTNKKKKVAKENKLSEKDDKDEEPRKPKTDSDTDKDKLDIFSSANKEPTEKEELVEKNPEVELEDGECSDTESEISDDENKSDISTSTASDDDSIAKHHPPCMRVIVRETNLPKLKVGSLFLITKDGGTLGREGEQHTILIKDHNVSRNHLDLRYDITKKAYMVTDLGSKNGTILNGSRMSESQICSNPMQVIHGSTIQLGETKLLCHIHPGNDTCGHCEPGLLMEMQEKENKIAYTRTCSVQKQHQLELARLKNKYAPKQLSIEATAYNDRAQARREAVGSSHHSEKTQSSDLETFITPENKGFKLLEKMGWSKGEGLGKDNQGDTEPVPLITNEGKAGLGTSGSNVAPTIVPTPKVVNTLGPATMRLAARTKMLQPPAKAFQPLEEDSE